MGIYYWLIHPYTYVWHTHVKEIACMQFPVDLSLSTDLLTSNGPIFVGSASNPAKYSAIRSHGQNCLCFPDPFRSVALPELLLSSAGPSQSAHHKRALTSAQRQFKASSDRTWDAFTLKTTVN